MKTTFASAVVLLLFHAVNAAAIEPKWLMDHDPQLPKPPLEVRFTPGLLELWIQALECSDRDLKRRAAAAVASAYQRGLRGISPAVDPLVKLLQQSDQDRSVRLTAARALTEIDAREAAPVLLENLNGTDTEMAEIVIPALSRWGGTAIRERLLEQIARPVTFRRQHVLAIRGLVSLQEERSLPRLLRLAEDRSVPSDVRLAAAGALGDLQTDGLGEVVSRLIANKAPAATVDRLVAALMMKGQTGQEAERQLLELAVDSHSPTQAIALEQLFRINPELILPFVETTITSRDVKVRHWGAETLISKPTIAHAAMLCTMLADHHRGLRGRVADALLVMSENDEFRDRIIADAREVLHGDEWQGQQQAMLLLVSLDDKSIANRLLELLQSDRHEVYTQAACCLSHLAVDDTAAPMLEVLEKRTEAALAAVPGADSYYQQVCHLIQALGHMRYAPADEALREYIAKGRGLRIQARAAAVWALGHMHADDPDERLIRQFRQRLIDVESIVPEEPEVRTMAAISLGRMGATEALISLRDMQRRDGSRTAVGHACQWAIHQLTGEPIPEKPPRVFWEEDWFLTPLERSSDQPE